MDEQHDIVVVGAGLAGLTAAALAARAGRRVAVVDGTRAGGRATTDVRNGYRFNQGPHAVYRDGAGRKVLARLGITPRGDKPAVKKALGLRGDRLGLLPAGPLSLLRTDLVTPRGKVDVARVLGRLGSFDAAANAHLSAAEWLASLGLRPEAAEMVEAIIHVSSYAGDLADLSADAAIGQLQMALGEGVDYLHGGWQQVVEALLAACDASGVARHLGSPALGVEAAGDGWAVRTAERSLSARAVVVAAGGPGAARALLPVEPGWGALGPDQTAACLQLGLSRVPENRLVFGLGEPLYLSCHCPPADLAPAGHSVVEVMRYGARSVAEDREQLWSLARTAGIGEADVVEQRFLARMVVAHAQPSPGAGLAGRPAVSVAEGSGLFVAGDWVGSVGMLADASYASAAAAADAAVAHTARVGAAR